MLPAHPHSIALALPVSTTGGSLAVDGSVVSFLLLAGIIVAGLLAALDLIVLVLAIVLLISLLILG